MWLIRFQARIETLLQSLFECVRICVCVFIHIMHHQWQSQLKNEIVLLLSFRFLPQLFLFLRAGPRVRAADGASASTVPALSVWARQEPKNMESLSAFNEKPQAQRADVEESIRAEHPFLSFSQFQSVGDLSHTWRNVCHFLLFDNLLKYRQQRQSLVNNICFMPLNKLQAATDLFMKWLVIKLVWFYTDLISDRS